MARIRFLLEAIKIVSLPPAQENTHLNVGSCEVITPTSSSEGLKSIDRTVDRHEIAVCVEREGEV